MSLRRSLDEECILIEGDVPLKRWFHLEHLGFLEKEMDDEEIEEKREWERKMDGEDNNEG